MKKLLALLLTLALVFTFTACGEQETDSSTSDNGVTEITLAEDLPVFTFSSPKYEQEIPEGSSEDCTHYYTLDKEGKDRFCKIFEIEKDGVSLEDYTKAEASEFGGCWSMSEFEGTECSTYCASYERDGAWYYDRSWIFEKEDKFYEISIYYATTEVQLGDSNIYMWMPCVYEENDDVSDDGLFASYEEAGSDEVLNVSKFAPFDIIEFIPSDLTYDEMFEFKSSNGADFPVTEEQWASWQADGWTLDEGMEYFKTLYDITEEKKYTKDDHDLDFWAFEEISKNQDGVEMNNVRVIVPYEGSIYGIKVYSTVDEWTNQGTAMANTIHVK